MMLSELCFVGTVSAHAGEVTKNNITIPVHLFKDVLKDAWKNCKTFAKYQKKAIFSKMPDVCNAAYIAAMEAATLEEFNTKMFENVDGVLALITPENFHDVHIAFIQRPKVNLK